MNSDKVKYKCLNEKCNLKYEGSIGPTSCPKCGGIWIYWIRHKDWDKANGVWLGKVKK